MHSNGVTHRMNSGSFRTSSSIITYLVPINCLSLSLSADVQLFPGNVCLLEKLLSPLQHIFGELHLSTMSFDWPSSNHGHVLCSCQDHSDYCTIVYHSAVVMYFLEQQLGQQGKAVPARQVAGRLFRQVSIGTTYTRVLVVALHEQIPITFIMERFIHNI